MDFTPNAQPSGFAQNFDRWYVRNYGTPEELDKYGFQKRGFLSFNVVELGFAFLTMLIVYRFFF